MKPEQNSIRLFSITRAKAKMYEYDVPEERHIPLHQHPAKLFRLSLAIIGELAAQVNSKQSDLEYISTLRESLTFSAYYFDAYLESRLELDLSPYLLLVGSAAYYLCDLPGSAYVLARRVSSEYPHLECSGLDHFAKWLLVGNFNAKFDESISFGSFETILSNLYQGLSVFQQSGRGYEAIEEWLNQLRVFAYQSGNPRELLFADIICAVTRKRLENSVWTCLPVYSDLNVELWENALTQQDFIKELWPAQHVLGKEGVLRGLSSVIQMPTSAGKTKSTELIIRSSFYSERAHLAVIVAPFKALCREIQDSFSKSFQDENVSIEMFSDALQDDFDFSGQLDKKQIVVVTPEKLVYVLRQQPELADQIGLLIYDEGHQFDNGSRGVTYELLLTSLRQMVSDETQVILISAVITNAEDIGQWMMGDGKVVVSGSKLLPTYRSLAFSSWRDRLGQLRFVAPEAPDTELFFVPRVLSTTFLNRKPRQRTDKYFPDNKDCNDVALLLGLNVVSNGSVAIFCGQKSTASKICSRAVDIFEREIEFSLPLEVCNSSEIERIHNLYSLHLGESSVAARSASIGVLSHHGNTPHGIRLAVEHAMQNGDAKFVVCTSTLAQGVNLPIRYLMVTGIYQAGKRIKVRDFHNLIGRAGRAGMHTEGSIIFTEHALYDEKESTRDGRWRWNTVKKLLDVDNSEACDSSILSLIKVPITNNNGKIFLEVSAIDIVNLYIQGFEIVDNFVDTIISSRSQDGFTESTLRPQIEEKISIVGAIESYLMAHWSEAPLELAEGNARSIAESTLAHYIATEEEQQTIIDVMSILARHISLIIPDDEKKESFGKMLKGSFSSVAIETWVHSNYNSFKSLDGIELAEALWPVFESTLRNTKFKNCDNKLILKEASSLWLQGVSYADICELFVKHDVRIGTGSRARKIKIDQTVEMCENVFSYEISLIVSAVTTILESSIEDDNEEIIKKLQLLQKMFRYGLLPSEAITVFELGFSDRAIAIDLASQMGLDSPSRSKLIKHIKKDRLAVEHSLSIYPAYYQSKLLELLDSN